MGKCLSSSFSQKSPLSPPRYQNFATQTQCNHLLPLPIPTVQLSTSMSPPALNALYPTHSPMAPVSCEEPTPTHSTSLTLSFTTCYQVKWVHPPSFFPLPLPTEELQLSCLLVPSSHLVPSTAQIFPSLQCIIFHWSPSTRLLGSELPRSSTCAGGAAQGPRWPRTTITTCHCHCSGGLRVQ